MAHIEIHKIKGRNYRYEVTNYREGKKVKHKWKYLGAVEPVQKRKKNFNAGRKPALKTRELNQEEKVFVAKSIKHSESFVKDRARIIELSTQNNSVKQICEKLKTDKKKVGQIINAFNKNGLKAFERKKNTGRPRRITKEQRAKMLEWLNTHPEKLELHFNNWSRVKLAEYANKNNILVSPSQVGRIIEQDETKYKTKRSKMFSNDKNFLRNI